MVARHGHGNPWRNARWKPFTTRGTRQKLATLAKDYIIACSLLMPPKSQQHATFLSKGALMITLDQEISTIGGWSTIYRIKGDDTLCAKVLAPHRKYKNQKPDPSIIALKKYGIADMLEYELANYNNIVSKVPADLLKYFVKFYGIEQTQCGQKALVMELVKNDLGEVAHNLSSNLRPLTTQFFKTLERIRREIFINHAIDHFGIACRNILARTTSDPVIIDFQNTKVRLKGQFWLNIPFFVRQKVTRKFQRVYSDLGVNDFTKIKNLDDIIIS